MYFVRDANCLLGKTPSSFMYFVSLPLQLTYKLYSLGYAYKRQKKH